jgi:hypothetical protein
MNNAGHYLDNWRSNRKLLQQNYFEIKRSRANSNLNWDSKFHLLRGIQQCDCIFELIGKLGNLLHFKLIQVNSHRLKIGWFLLGNHLH